MAEKIETLPPLPAPVSEPVPPGGVIPPMPAAVAGFAGQRVRRLSAPGGAASHLPSFLAGPDPVVLEVRSLAEQARMTLGQAVTSLQTLLPQAERLLEGIAKVPEGAKLARAEGLDVGAAEKLLKALQAAMK